jgi:hypothetical protein
MAGPTTTSRRSRGVGSEDDASVFHELLVEHNAMVDDLETLRAALSAGGVVAVLELMADHATAKAAIDKQKRVMINMPLATAAVAIGTTVQKVQTTAIATYLCDGVFKSKAATDDFWTLSGTTVSDGNFQKYLLCIDASGDASIVEGTQAATAGAVVLGAWPASKSVLAILQVQTVGGTFVPGTTGLDAGTVTDTYINGFDPALIEDAPATLSAAAPSGTAVDQAGDMLAGKIGDRFGVPIALSS